MDWGKKKNNIFFLLAIDLAAISVSYLGVNFVRTGNVLGPRLSIGNVSPFLFLLLIYVVLFFLRISAVDFANRSGVEEFITVFKYVLLLSLFMLLGLFFLKESEKYSRITFFCFIVTCTLVMFTARNLYKYWLLKVFRKSIYGKRLVIVTVEDQAEEIANRILKKKKELWEYELVGIIVVDGSKDLIGSTICGIPVWGNFDNMYRCVKREAVDDIFIDVPYSTGVHIAQAIEKYESMGITVNLNVQAYGLPLKYKKKELRSFGDYYVISFCETVITTRMVVVKRLMDICGALIGLLVTAVATIFVAPPLLIESPGPLFFAQTRVGRNGRLFKMYKFRSMYADAEERKKELMAKNEMDSGLMFKIEDDPRITKVGKVIRKLSIDELPQFWNVLKGDMSLIGTRPPTLDEFQMYKSSYKRRLSIRPGITGMWQVSGRSDIKNFDEVLALDLEYIDNWSVTLDLKLLFKTVWVALFGKGAS